MPENNIIKSRKPEPDTRSWYEYIWRQQQDTPERIEDAAKFMATMISVSLTIFLAIGKSTFESPEISCQIKIAIILWITSLICSFLVLFPWRYSYSSVSVKSVKKMHRKIVLVKYTLLIVCLVLFLIALSILAFLFLI